MKSFQVVIVTILFMALLMTSDAGKGKCKKSELRHVYNFVPRAIVEVT